MEILQSQPYISLKEIDAVTKVLKSNYVVEGSITKKFEDKLKKYFQTKYAVTVNSGSMAMQLALLSLKEKNKNEVIIPNYTCTAVYNSVIAAGCKPVLTDIDLENLALEPKKIVEKITNNTLAIILVHPFGTTIEKKEYFKYEIPVIDDISHSIGALSKDGTRLSKKSFISVASFYATKMICTVEGGMILTDNQKLNQKILKCKYNDGVINNKIQHYNSKFNDIFSVLGIEQFKRLNKFIEKRRKISKYYDKNIKKKKGFHFIQRDYKRDVFYRYIFFVKSGRDELLNYLNKNGIIADKPVIKPLHRYLNLKDNDFLNSIKIDEQIISLPIYPKLKKMEMEYIVSKLNKFKGL